MASAIKEKFVTELEKELKDSPHVVVTDYQGLKAEEFNELRAKLRTVGSKYKVVKNRLARIALTNLGWTSVGEAMKGPSALAYLGKDTAGLTRVLKEFGATHQTFKMKAGQVYGFFANAESLKQIATLPSREVLLSTLLARMNAPLQKLMATMNEPVRGLHAALSAVAKKKESAPAA